MKTQENSVFKGFIALCILISLGILYILLIRPLKIVVETADIESDELLFSYNESKINPPLETIIKRSKEGKHIIVVLLSPKRRLLANYKYDFLLEQFKKCEGKLPCNILSMEKKKFMDESKRRKDIGYQPGQIKM
jgi:hypothetical protein